MSSASRPLAARATRQAVLAAGGGVLLLVLLPPLFGAHYFGLDLSSVDLGLLCEIRNLLQADEPLWLAPHLGRGSPLFANPHAQLLYPPRWLALLLPPDWGSSLGVALHLAGAAAASTWLARTFGVRPLAASVAGVSFAASGTVIDLIGHQSYLITAVYLPLAWAAARAFLHPRGEARHLAVLCLALTFCVLGGEPQGFAMAAGVALLEVGLRYRTPAAGLKAACVGGAATLAVVASLAQLLPTIGEARFSGRLGETVLDTVLALSLDGPTALSAFLPISLTAPVGDGGQLYGVFTDSLGPWNAHAFLGLVVLAAALAGVPLRRLRAASVVAVAALVFALGENTFVYPTLVRAVSLLGMFRYPAKYFLAVDLAAVMLAFAALDGARRGRRARVRLLLTSAAVSVATLIGGAILFGAGADLDAAAGASAGAELPMPSALLEQALLLAAGPLLLLVLLLSAERFGRFLLPVAAASVLLPAVGFVQTGPSVLDAQSAVEVADAPPGQVVCVDERLRGRSVLYRGESASWVGLLRKYFLGMHELAACAGQVSPVPYSPLNSSIEHALDQELYADRERILRVLGCQAVIVPTDEGGGPFGAAVRPFSAAIEDAFVVDEPVRAAPEDILEAIFSGVREPLSLVDQLGEDEGRPLPDGEGASVAGLRSPRPDEIVVELGGTGGAIFALRNAYRAGWTAAQSAEPLPVVRVGGTLLGVVVPDVSRGPVEFRYRPPHLVAGVAGSAGGGLGLVLLVWGAGRRLRRRPATSSQKTG